MKTEFTKEYFIKKFEAIDEKKWTTGMLKVTISTFEDLYQMKCALGHCDVKDVYLNDEARALSLLFSPNQIGRISGVPVILANDDVDQMLFKGETPKQRILNFLYSI